MAFEKPWGSLHLEARSSDELDRDDALIDAVAKLVPEDVVRRQVTACLRERLQCEVGVALGDPIGTFWSKGGRWRAPVLAAQVAGAEPILSYAQHASAELSSPFPVAVGMGSAFDRVVIAEELRLPDPNAEFLASETTTARFEVARDWLSGVALAWASWGEAVGNLRLDATSLMPLNPGGEHEAAFVSWKERRDEGLASLTASVALDAAGYEAVMESFAQAIAGQLRKRPLELPDGLQLSSHEGALVAQKPMQRDEVLASS